MGFMRRVAVKAYDDASHCQKLSSAYARFTCNPALGNPLGLRLRSRRSTTFGVLPIFRSTRGRAYSTELRCAHLRSQAKDLKPLLIFSEGPEAL
jgi:hypothetical protein